MIDKFVLPSSSYQVNSEVQIVNDVRDAICQTEPATPLKPTQLYVPTMFQFLRRRSIIQPSLMPLRPSMVSNLVSFHWRRLKSLICTSNTNETQENQQNKILFTFPHQCVIAFTATFLPSLMSSSFDNVVCMDAHNPVYNCTLYVC